MHPPFPLLALLPALGAIASVGAGAAGGAGLVGGLAAFGSALTLGTVTATGAAATIGAIGLAASVGSAVYGTVQGFKAQKQQKEIAKDVAKSEMRARGAAADARAASIARAQAAFGSSDTRMLGPRSTGRPTVLARGGMTLGPTVRVLG